jgi:hypothetical protein
LAREELRAIEAERFDGDGNFPATAMGTGTCDNLNADAGLGVWRTAASMVAIVT